jgi:guanylate kinase
MVEVALLANSNYLDYCNEDLNKHPFYKESNFRFTDLREILWIKNLAQGFENKKNKSINFNIFENMSSLLKHIEYNKIDLILYDDNLVSSYKSEYFYYKKGLSKTENNINLIKNIDKKIKIIFLCNNALCSVMNQTTPYPESQKLHPGLRTIDNFYDSVIANNYQMSINTENINKKYQSMRFDSILQMCYLEIFSKEKYHEHYRNDPYFFDFWVNEKKKKLNIILGPSGFGKTTFIDYLSYLGFKKASKLTTRPYRSFQEMDGSDLVSYDTHQFNYLVNNNLILGEHVYQNNSYGMKKNIFENIDEFDREYLIDSCDPKSAIKLRDNYPNEVRLISLFPNIHFAGYGLENRINQFGYSYDYSSIVDEYEAVKKSKFVVKNTKDRLNKIIQQSENFQQYLSDFDLNLTSTNIDDNAMRLIEYVVGER